MTKIGGERRVSYLGPEGTFCEQAARKHFLEAIFVPYSSINEVFSAVERGDTEYGVVPVENSTDGSITITLDCLLTSRVVICGEVELKITHNLISKPNTCKSEIELIISHPQALAQCREFIKRNFPEAELRESSSTAKAVELLKNFDNSAAIGTEAAAKRSRGVILRRNIEDEVNNVTRFFVIGKKEVGPSGKDKTSLVFSTKHIPGSLYRVLEVFAIRNINLTKIESRPEKRRRWSYVFYVDIEGHKIDPIVREALDSMKKRCIHVKVLGSYPKAC